MSAATRQRLVELYRQMAEHTVGECGRPCGRNPGGCCHEEYCALTIDHALRDWGIDLKPTGFDPRLPLLGPNGCTAAPHLRPICTLHTCQVASRGGKRDDPEWTRRYFEIRDEIDGLVLEAEAAEDVMLDPIVVQDRWFNPEAYQGPAGTDCGVEQPGSSLGS